MQNRFTDIEKTIWPNLFIIGAAKSGTTTLYEILSRIPGIYMAPYKEPEFFAPNSPTCKEKKYYSIEENYTRLFAGAKNASVIGEASTFYLWDPDSPKSIHDKIPNARIMAILRNPIDRAFSDYLWHKYLRNIQTPFDEAVKIELHELDKNGTPFLEASFPFVQMGLYFASLSKYFSLFHGNQIKVLIFEEFVKNTKFYVNDVLNFLGINGQTIDTKDKADNKYRKPRNKLASSLIANIHNNTTLLKLYHHLPYTYQNSLSIAYRKFESILLDAKSKKPEMSSETRKILRQFYAQDVARLEMLLERQLPWSDFN